MYYYARPEQPTNYVLQSDAASEPVTLDEVKTHLRIDGSDYDDILTPLITTARQLGEKITGRDFINKTWKTYLNFFPSSDIGIQIKKSKLQSITSIKYYTDNVLTTFDSSKYFITDDVNYSHICLVDNESYPTVDDRCQAVEIIFVSGYGVDATAVPQPIKQAILAHIAYLYNNAGDCVKAGDSLFKAMYYPYIIPTMLVDFI